MVSISLFDIDIEKGNSRRSNISVEFSDLGFRVMAPGDLSAIELDSTLDMLYSRVKEQELNQTNQVCIYFILVSMSTFKWLPLFIHLNESMSIPSA